MQCPSCHHSMASCHEDRHTLYYQCKHGTCFAAVVKCKHCDLIKVSKIRCMKNIKFNMSKHYKQIHLQLQPLSSSLQPSQSSNAMHGPNNTTMTSIDNGTISALSISTMSKSDQSQLTALTSQTVNTIAMNQLYNQFNYFDNKQNQMYFFLDMFYPPHGGARGIAWSVIIQSANNTYNISTLDKTHFLFKNYKLITSYSSKHRGNLMEILKNTVKYSNVNNSVIPRIPIYDNNIYKIFIGGKHSIQANLPAPSTFNIANTVCMLLDSYIDHILAHGIPIYLLMTH